MDMSAVPKARARSSEFPLGRGTKIPDLPVLFAVLAARQAAGLTAKRVREGNPPDFAGDEPARMAVIFAPGQPGRTRASGAAGSFNIGVARNLSMGADGEVGVYSGT